MKKIRDSFAEAKLPMPKIENREGGVLVTIQRSPLFEKLYLGEPLNDTQNDTKNDTQKLTSRQEAILALIRDNIDITGKELANKLKTSLPTIRRDLSTLRKLGVVIYAGSSKYGHWEILKSFE